MNEAALKVTLDHWVSVQFEIFDSMGERIAGQAADHNEMVFLFGGYGAILPKLEVQLDGLSVGEQCTAYLEPEDSFGDYIPELVTMIAVDKLPEGVEIGMSFEGLPGLPSDGEVYMVTDIADGQAVLDSNHPLAGIALRYQLTVLEVRAATTEEVQQERNKTGSRSNTMH